MYYRGGWFAGGIGLAFSNDGISWKKHAGNPIFGLNGSNFSQGAMQPFVVAPTQADEQWRLYVSSSNGLAAATSDDGIAWKVEPGTSLPMPPSKTVVGNRAAWQERDGSWFMFQEVGPAPWEIYLYKSNDGFNWKLENGGRPLDDLQRTPGGMYGGPSLATINGVVRPQDDAGNYHLFYHAASAAGDLPTNIYHASAASLTGPWAVNPAHTPLLTHRGNGTFEYDQVADPSAAVQGSSALLLYDGDNNQIGTAAIGAAVAKVNAVQ